MPPRHNTPLTPIAIALLSLLATPLAFEPGLATEQAVAPEHNPPGDIPDSQVFLAYAGPGFSMQVPEGWSRKDLPNGARFFDKYNIIEITVDTATAAPTADEVKAGQAAELVSAGHGVEIAGIKPVKLKSGPAIRIDYQSNSEPNSVTGKQIRLERVRYLYFKGGKLVTLDMAAPQGADNVDQWLLMANSVQLD